MKQKNIKQILLHIKHHLDANKIDDESLYDGWYRGKKENFIKTHTIAKKWVDKMIEEVKK